MFVPSDQHLPIPSDPSNHPATLFLWVQCFNVTDEIVQYLTLLSDLSHLQECLFCWFLFSLSVVSDSLRPHGLQHTRPPCPSLTPRAGSNSYPLSRWCHPTILSSVVPFSSSPQSFPTSGSFPMSQLFPLGGQSIGVSASTSVLPMNIQGWFPLVLTGLIFLLSKVLSRVILVSIC